MVVRVAMGLLGDVVVVIQLTTLAVVLEKKGWVLVSWVVAMVILMGSQVDQMLGGLSLYREGLMELVK